MNNGPDHDRLKLTLRRARLVVIGGFCWFTFFMVLPDFFMSAFRVRNFAVYSVLEILSVLVLGAGTIFLTRQIRMLTTISRPVLVGVALAAFAQLYKTLGNPSLFPALSHSNNDFLFHLFYTLPNGLGLTMFVCGLFYAIVELLVTRHQLRIDRERLVCEIAERERAEKSVAEHRMKIVESARLSALGSMAGGLAHEINNPLAVISGTQEQLTRLLHSPQHDSGLAETLLDAMRRNIIRIQSIIRSLRNLAKDGASDPFVTIPLSSLVNDTLELCQEHFRANGITLEISEVPQSLEVHCRPTEISQILLNLLNNAMDAVVSCDKKWISVDVADTDGKVTIAITDSGPGIPPEDKPKVFDPFFSTKPAGAGIGIGLSLAQRMAKAHHGELRLAPDSPNTRFVLTLPKKQALKQ